MSLSSIPRVMRLEIFARDQGRCRYCPLCQIGQASVFHINHIVPRSKGGSTIIENLALQCPWCNLHKANKTRGPDLASGDPVPLFHPGRYDWFEHFSILPGGALASQTSIGRATIDALRVNESIPRTARALQLLLQFYGSRLIGPLMCSKVCGDSPAVALRTSFDFTIAIHLSLTQCKNLTRVASSGHICGRA